MKMKRFSIYNCYFVLGKSLYSKSERSKKTSTSNSVKTSEMEKDITYKDVYRRD